MADNDDNDGKVKQGNVDGVRLAREAVGSSTAIRRVNDTLQGPVADILSQVVPELKALPRDKTYDHALDNLGLLQQCFHTFRTRRHLFRFVVVDATHRPVENDTTPLYCGRTLEEVTGMIVRTAAKRYFRQKLGKKPASAADPIKPKSDKEPPRTAADELYSAIRDYLLHEWQVPLVPAYADMPPGLVRQLGDKILNLRTPEGVRRTIADPRHADKLEVVAAPATAPAPEKVEMAPVPTRPAQAEDRRARLSEILSEDGTRLKAEAFSSTLLDPALRALLPPVQSLRLTDPLRGVGGLPVRLLVSELGLRQDQLALLLILSHAAIGDEVFRRLFGPGGSSELVERIIDRARLSGLDQTSPLERCAEFVTQLFARAQTAARPG